MASASNPILIVGAGPSGLVLALSLLKNGVPVRIIDKENTPRPGERGPGIMPRSLELHRILGTYDDIAGAATMAPEMRKYDPADGTTVSKIISLLPPFEATPQMPIGIPVLLGQHYQESILRSHLEKMGASVEFGSELRSFKVNEDNIIAEIVRNSDGKSVVEEMKTPWLFGADGAHSVVRKTLGLGFAGETQDTDVALVDIKVEGELLKYWENWGEPISRIAHLRPSGQNDHIVHMLMGGPNVDVAKVVTSRDTVIEEFYKITGRRDIVFGEMVCSSRYRPNIRMVEQFRVGRVLIGGDAAHCHSPAGGQGLNSSILDSFNLGWKLALVYKGLAPASLLDTYDEERLPIIAEMLGATTKLLKQVMTKGTESIRRGGDLRQLGVNYRGSSIVYEDDVDVPTVKGLGYNPESETAARPGDRAPEAPSLTEISPEGKVFALYGIFSPFRHTILVFSDPSFDYKDLSEAIKGLPDGTVHGVLILPRGTVGHDEEVSKLFDQVLVDTEGHAYTGYYVTVPAIAIVRPDGVVGARVRSAAGVKKYFGGIFNQ